MRSRLLIFALLLPLCTQAQSTISVADFGAQPDGILRTDGAITAGSSLLTSASGTFSPSDAGKYIQIIGAGNGGTTHSDGVIAFGSKILTSVSGTFAQTDVGRSMVVVGAGTGGQNLITHIAAFNSSSSVTLVDPAISAAAGAAYFYGAMTLEGTIQSVQNAGSVTLSTPALASISNATYVYGTNYSAIFQQAVDAAGQAGGATVLVPGATSCPAGAVCGYVIAATDQMTAHAPGAVKIRYDNISLVGSDPQTNLFCRGAWGLYTNSAIFPGKTATIRGTCIALGDDEGANGAAGKNLSNITIAKLHLYGMTDGNTYTIQFSPVSPPLTTTGDGWDETHKAILMWPHGTFSNIVIDSVYIQDFKGENIYSGGSAITGMVIQNSTLTNFNGDGISLLAADLEVTNSTITNGSNAGIENATISTGSAALVQQLYQGNTISDFPREAIVIVGVDNGVAAGAVQIINNTFDTIGQINASSGGVAIVLGPQAAGNRPPANVTIAGNTCHDCYAFSWLQTSGHSQVTNNTIVVDHYSSGDLINLSFRMNDVVVANNSGYRSAEAAAKGRGVADVYVLDWGNSTLPWTNVLIHDNSWVFPGSLNYLFITNSGAGWSAVNSQNIVWQNETCTGCTYAINHGLAVVSDSPTIPPFGPEVALVEYGGAPVNVTVDASKEQDGAELTILNSGSQSVTFNPDGNIALSSPVTVPKGGSVFFRYSGLAGKFILAQRPTTISANSNATPQSVAVNNAFGSALAATVLDGANNPFAGIAVAFTAPASGASGTFANTTNTTTVLTDAAGVATASAFSANSSAGGPYTVTATASGVATPATFSLTNLLPPVSITVQTSPTGRSFTVDNVAYASSQTFQWTPNSSHTIGTTATQAGSAGAQFVFASWSDNGAISQVILVPYAAAAYTANFDTQYQLTTSVNPTQGGTATAGGWFNSGSDVQVQATPNPGYQFSGFSGNLTGTTNPQTVVMNAPNSVTANFGTAQTITFGALSGQLLGAAPFAVSATASSSLPTSFNSQTTSVCTVSVATVTLLALGVCTIQATQAGNTNYAAAAPVNQSFQVTAPVGGGSLQGSGTSTTTAVNLTTEGTGDWVHWGDGSLNRKAGVTVQLSPYTVVGGGTVFTYINDPRTVSWTDGAPTASSRNNQNGLYISGTGQGFSFTAPADTTSRTLVVHVGGYTSRGTLTAHLSDGSAVDFTDIAGAVGQYDRNYTLIYQAASAGQTLLVSWTMVSANGNVTLNAAALQGGGGTGTGSIVASAGTPQGATVSTAFATALQATVKDSGGNPVSGATVTFSAPTTGASGTFSGSATASSVTNASGVATAPALTANAQNGAYTVTASVAGVATPASFSLVNVSAAAASIVVSTGTLQSAAVGTAFLQKLQATVKDSGGNPVGGATVIFSAPATGASGTFGGMVTVSSVTSTNGMSGAPTLMANATVGSYTVTASVAGVATPANFSLTNAPVGGGSLQGSGTSATTAVNLSTEGSVDWVHWGYSGYGEDFGYLNRKAGVAGQLSTYTKVGSGFPFFYDNDPRPMSWTDGTGKASSSGNLLGVYISGTGQGFSFTAPADTTSRTVVVHVGGYSSGGTLTAHLSDLSAVDFTDTTAAANGQYDRNYTLIYRAALAGQTLTVTWTMTSGSGNVTLSAAALQGGPGTGTGSIVASAGTPQGATVSTAFATALQATVKDSGGNPVSGATVTFSAPGLGPGGAFSGSATASSVTNASGVATAPTLTANAQNGAYTVTASVAGVATPASFRLTNAPVGGGSLQGSGTSATTAVNLTTEGTGDWVHWGDTSLNRKAGVAAQLSTYTVVGGGTATKYANDSRPMSWTAGTPTASSTNNLKGVYVSGTGKGFSITAPADPTTRTMIVHVGGWNSGGTLTAHLSDGSAPDFTNTTSTASGQYDRNYTLTYQAAAAGQTLTVTWKMASGSGNVTLSATATLAVTSANAANRVYSPGSNTLFYLPLDGPTPIAAEGCSVVGGPALTAIADRFGNASSAIHVGATASPFDYFRIQCSNTKIASSAKVSPSAIGYA